MSDIKEFSPAKRRMYMLLSEYWIVLVFLLIYGIFIILEPLCFSLPFLSSTLNYMTEILILGVGVMFVVITAGIDLSIGPVEGAVGVGAALTMRSLVPVVGVPLAITAGVIVGILMGMVIGLLNGLIVTKMKLAPFIATLGMSVILTGSGYIFNNGLEVVGLPKVLARLGNMQFFGFIGTTTIVAWTVWLIFGIILKHTRFGVITYAYGSNPESTARAGINVDRHLIKVFMISSTLAALSGVLLIFRFNTGSPIAGANVTLYAIASCIIGGTSVLGGRGKMIGTLIGAAIISILVTGLVMLGVQTYWQQVATGLIIIFSVYADQLRQRNAFM
ncbi:MAG: ABC transporter permease [Sphaerochaetaceae bacterium]|nr:ABC transporter permease [Sphaerochaetaceae bacterium]